MVRKKKTLKVHQNLACHWHCPCEDCTNEKSLESIPILWD